ncbi:MAG: hypothetical protein FJW39_08460 [Acidobacteria bacterium]|nr:hypothetical protein [Acidobacteriota bacterium]
MAPTASCVNTKTTTSDRCTCSGLTRPVSTRSSFAPAGGRVSRVVEKLSRASGIPGALARARFARHSDTLTDSIVIAPSGQALTQAGSIP